jgi:hypothetical protein
MIRSPAGFDGGDRIKRYLDYYQPSYGVMMLSAGQFSPASLFAGGEQGAWYDPSDFSTMFQESTGVTPVTAVEQPVGLILDKSKGLALGSELVTNGDFSSGTTGWTVGPTSTFSVIDGQIKVISTSADAAYFGQLVSVVAGKSYRVAFTTISDGTSKIARLFVGSFWSGTAITPNSFGSHTVIWEATTSGSVVFWPYGSVGGVGTYILCDNISVRELPGNHASQSTSASRPVLSARVNLLTYSEQFDNAAWTKGSLVTTGMGNVTATTDPLGGYTADKLQETATTAEHYVLQGVSVAAAQHTFSVYLKAAERTWATIYFSTGSATPTWFNLAADGTGVPGTVASGFTAASTYVGNGWYRCSITGTSTATTWYAIVNPSLGNNLSVSYAGTLNSGIYIWGADLRVTNDGVGIPAYQRVAAATDYDTSGFPLYLKFDGTDDSLATASVDFSATDKMSVFAGARKLSDAAAGIFAELSATVATNDGAFYFALPEDTGASGNYSWKSRGNVNPLVPVKSGTILAPNTAVLTGLGNISGDVATLRVNGTQAATSSVDQGTGNYGNYPLYIGRRNNASLPYNGRLYSLIVRGAQSTDAQIASTEAWVNGKTKAY